MRVRRSIVSTDLRDQLEHASDSSLGLSPFPKFLDVLLDDKARIKIELMDEPECFVAAILLALTGLVSISVLSLGCTTASAPRPSLSKPALQHQS
jgi:hypothetical protein